MAIAELKNRVFVISSGFIFVYLIEHQKAGNVYTTTIFVVKEWLIKLKRIGIDLKENGMTTIKGENFPKVQHFWKAERLF